MGLVCVNLANISVRSHRVSFNHFCCNQLYSSKPAYVTQNLIQHAYVPLFDSNDKCNSQGNRDKHVDCPSTANIHQTCLWSDLVRDAHLRQPVRVNGQLNAVVLLHVFVCHLFQTLPLRKVLHALNKKIALHEYRTPRARAGHNHVHGHILD